MPTCRHRATVKDRDGRSSYQVLPCRSWSCRACTENFLLPRCKDRCRELLTRSLALHDVEILYRLEVPKSEWAATLQAIRRSKLQHKTFVHIDGHATAIIYLLEPFRNTRKLTGRRAEDAIFRDLARMPHQSHCCTASRDMPTLHNPRQDSGLRIIHTLHKPSPQGVRLAAELAGIPVSPPPRNPRKNLTTAVKMDTRHLDDDQLRHFMEYAYALSTTEDLAAMHRPDYSISPSNPIQSFTDTQCPGCGEILHANTGSVTLSG